jgi:hypothetical protein
VDTGPNKEFPTQLKPGMSANQLRKSRTKGGIRLGSNPSHKL